VPEAAAEERVGGGGGGGGGGGAGTGGASVARSWICTATENTRLAPISWQSDRRDVK
jgi:hypothetical protein